MSQRLTACVCGRKQLCSAGPMQCHLMRRIQVDRTRAVGVSVIELKRLHALLILNLILGAILLLLLITQ